MFDQLMRFVRVKRPSLVLLENVEGLMSQDGGKAIAHIVDSLNAQGYNLAYRVLKCSDYGIPQTKKRVFIVGLYYRVKPVLSLGAIFDMEYLEKDCSLSNFIRVDVISKYAHTIRKGGRSSKIGCTASRDPRNVCEAVTSSHLSL